MTWTTDEWDAFAAILEHGFPGSFGPDAGRAYRVLLDDVEPLAAVAALKTFANRGGKFRPSAPEIIGETRADPGRPTWSEAFRLLFGARGLLTVRPEASALQRAEDRHPLLAAFIRQEGYERLGMLPVHDPDNPWCRKDLERAWDALERRADDRQAAGLAFDEITRPRRPGLSKPAYLRALPGGRTA